MGGPQSRYAVVHYAEIGLKGRNRPFFERTLARRITQRMEPLGFERVERLSGRFLLQAAQPLTESDWASRLSTVFGIAHFAPAYVAECDFSSIRDVTLENLPQGPVDTFRIRATRDDKTFPMKSPEIERELGAAVQGQTGWPVKLKGAALSIRVEVLRNRAIVSLGQIPGPGGLPVGASGRVALLLSGGIDSPVAGYMALKRGCRVFAVHFHSRPFGNWMGSESRVREIVRQMDPYGLESTLHVAPIGRQQREITARGPVAYRVILYRRLMVRVGEAIARREKWKALFTGESLGQVASQTLDSLAVVQEGVGIPILRPLVGMDKKEIVVWAEKIGTLQLSQMEGDDCCQFLMPNRVVTHPQLDEVLSAEAAVEMDRLVQEAVAAVTRVEIEQR